MCTHFSIVTQKMSSHMGTNFLNSCLKVPIDPCNNCPAPVYNRPKIYLGRSTTTISKVTTTSKISDYDLDLDTMFATSAVRSLAKFYDSIPDYCEVNHLPEEEFYSTLETLKSTCRTLKSKPSAPFLVRNESNNSSVSQQSYGVLQSCKTKIPRESSSKSSKKRSASRKSCVNKDCRSISASPCVSSYRNLCERMRILSYKRFDNIGVERLSERPKRLPRRESTPLHRSLSVCHLTKTENHPIKKEPEKKEDETSKPDEKPYSRPNTPCIRESLRKSFSFNDLNGTYWQEGSKKETAKRFRRYLDEELKSPRISQDDIPKIIVQSPTLNDNKVESSKTSSLSSASSTLKNKSKAKKSGSCTRVPFSFLGIDDLKLSDKTPSASPIHPVARPNLAATLRAEVSKKKVKELESNCTFKDPTPQVDWEVRKTPAWKSLNLNESHKEILALRLATRKAEQALQQREYELHMELMRQRVKSAPLLLEGTTFWGPHVGKLSHSCHKDSLKHTCQHGKKGRRKNTVSKSQHRKCLSNKTYSRNSNHSTNLQDSDELSSFDRAYL